MLHVFLAFLLYLKMQPVVIYYYYYCCCCWVEWDWVYFEHWPLLGLLYQPLNDNDDRWVRSSLWNGNWQRKLKYLEKTSPSTILFTINPTWPALESNLGGHGGKQVANLLKCGTVKTIHSSETCHKLLSDYMASHLKWQYLS